MRNKLQDSITNKKYREAHKERLKELRRKRLATTEGQAKQHAAGIKYHENLENYLKIMVERARTRNKKGHDFDIDFAFVREQYVKQKGRCFYTGLPLVIKRGLGKGSKNRLAPSLERVENSKGYTRENTVIVCVHANRAKMHYDLEELLELSQRLARRLPKIIRERNSYRGSRL